MKFSLSSFLLMQGMSSCYGIRSTPKRSLLESIHSYTPTSLVTDVAAIDLDLNVIRHELAKETQRGWSNAESVYREGAYSKPVARITLHRPLNASITAGTAVRGLDTGGFDVSGTLLEDVDEKDKEILIRYDINEVQANYVNCQVGGNPAPNVAGCFNSTGNLLVMGDVNDEAYSYDYDVMEDNLNDRSIESLSSTAQERMWECSHCPFPDYVKFHDYYGESNYADRIITAAFRGEETSLKNGNMDFGVYSEYGLGAFIRKAMSYMSIWMYTIRQMEQGIAECDKKDLEKGAHFWDEAVAYYTGSRSLIPEHNGDLIFHQAELRCDEFVTCGENSDSRDGSSFVNTEAFQHFREGQENLLAGQCEKARVNKERIVTMMTIPLIQGTLRYAHIITHEDNFYEKHGAEGTLYALSVLPLINKCSKRSAKIIYDQMHAKNTANVDFTTVKKAFENTYSCLNIQCHEVGGIWDASTGDYKTDALPCGIEETNWALIAGAAGGALLLVSCMVGLCLLRKRRRSREGKEEDLPEFAIDDDRMEDVPVMDDKQMT